ncbi:MAG: hypothetical protein R3A80_09625 [Bdellovibrionota bacterium]
MNLDKRVLGVIYLFFWGVLIIAGIVAKRTYGHPDWMVLFHLPAAVFLVMGMRQFSYRYKKEYEKDLSKYKPKHDLDQGLVEPRGLE